MDFRILKYGVFDMNKICAKRITSIKFNSVIAGLATLDDEWTANDVKSPFTRIYYIKSGTGYLCCKNKKIKMCGGNVYIIPAETVFSYSGIKGENMEKVFFHIASSTDEYIDPLAELNEIYSMKTEKDVIGNLFNLYKNNDLLSNLKIKNILYKTVIDLYEQYNLKFVVKNYSTAVNKAIEFIKENLNAWLTLTEISENVMVNPNTLRKIFKDETGFTVCAYIDMLLINKAKWLLIHSKNSIREISEELGYSDQFYFSKRFKQLENKTPMQFRKDNSLFMF
jgi:AraC-like DNA-binding protein